MVCRELSMDAASYIEGIIAATDNDDRHNSPRHRFFFNISLKSQHPILPLPITLPPWLLVCPLLINQRQGHAAASFAANRGSSNHPAALIEQPRLWSPLSLRALLCCCNEQLDRSFVLFQLTLLPELISSALPLLLFLFTSSSIAPDLAPRLESIPLATLSYYKRFSIMAEAIKSALPSHLRPAGQGEENNGFEKRHHGKTRSHMVSIVLL